MSKEIELSNGASLTTGRNGENFGGEHYLIVHTGMADSVSHAIPKQDQEKAAEFFREFANALSPPPDKCDGPCERRLVKGDLYRKWSNNETGHTITLCERCDPYWEDDEPPKKAKRELVE